MTKVVKAASPEQIRAAEEQAAKPPPKYVGETKREKAIELAFPIEFDGKVYSELTVRRMTGRDLKSLQQHQNKNEDEAETFLLSIMTGAPVEVINYLDGDDYLSVMEAAEPFLPRRILEEAKRTASAGRNTQHS
ncbi:MAG: phage tail assembly protein [Roseibium sp.]|nr:phage tail assembly protein [Roseibium sp.]